MTLSINGNTIIQQIKSGSIFELQKFSLHIFSTEDNYNSLNVDFFAVGFY